MFNKFKASIRLRGSYQGEDENKISSLNPTSTSLQSKEIRGSKLSAPSTVRGHELEESRGNVERLGKTLKSKLIIKAQVMRSSASEPSSEFDLSDESEFWDLSSVGTFHIVIPTTSSLCLSPGGGSLSISPGCNSPQVAFVLEQAQSTRMQLVSVLDAYNNSMDSSGSGSTPIEYLSLFKVR